MTDKKDFYTKENAIRVFNENIIDSGSRGIDGTSTLIFNKNLDENIDILLRKIEKGYKFTNYKSKLISKGKNKPPREISIPTIRDKVLLRMICDYLSNVYEDQIKFELPQKIIRNIQNDISTLKYDYVIKVDIKDFYPSINHNFLLQKINKKADHKTKKIISLAIKNPTVFTGSTASSINEKGIPQGLSISNILASIYILDIDNHFNSKLNISYYRYVDDIIIFCGEKDTITLKEELIDKFSLLDLSIHPFEDKNKSECKLITSNFNYLGYNFNNLHIRAKKESYKKIKESIISDFVSYKHSNTKNKERLKFLVNLRITGCIFEGKRRGWVFFYSEMNNESQLHTLDKFVLNLCQRFSINFTPKKFVRTYKEIRFNHNTRYIPNFDNKNIEYKKECLQKILDCDVDKLSNIEITQLFNKKIKKRIKYLEEDIRGNNSGMN
jgi:retron-type reverse transcriptase